MLSLTFFLYFGQLGVLVPYLGVFLDGRGFNSQEIGELFALVTLMRIIGPNLFASFADKSGKSLGILQIGAFLTFATFCSIFWLNSFWGLTIAFGLMMLFLLRLLRRLKSLPLAACGVMPQNTATCACGEHRVYRADGACREID
ncbi:MFS transporter [Paraglaciecola sp. Hal342]